MVTQAYNLSMWEVETGGLGVQDPLAPDYMRLSQKQNKIQGVKK